MHIQREYHGIKKQNNIDLFRVFGGTTGRSSPPHWRPQALPEHGYQPFAPSKILRDEYCSDDAIVIFGAYYHNHSTVDRDTRGFGLV
jgi:hypothetical protein